MEKYAKIRDNNLKEQNRRFGEVKEKYNDIALLLDNKRQLQMSFDLVLSSEEAFIKYTAQIKDINRQIEDALENYGLPRNYLAPIYNCPVCEDKGFYYTDDVFPVRCKCNVEDGFGASFADFDLSLFSKENIEGETISPFERMITIKEYAVNYCNNFPNNDKLNIIFYGGSGLGKSFLASCMCSEIASRGFHAVKVNAYKLIEDFKARHLEGTPFPKDYYGCDFLVIDDIGTEPKYNNITTEYLFALINERIESQKATLFITNQGYEACAIRYDDRLASRMFDGLNTKPIKFIGNNLRLTRR